MKMAFHLSYVIGFIAFALIAYDPIIRVLAPGLLPSSSSPTASSSQSSRRRPRPQLNESLLAMEDSLSANLTCPLDAYSIHIFSHVPLVIYIENFLSATERRHLLEVAEPLFEASTVTDDGGVRRDRSVRESEVAMVPRTEVVRCVEARARALQGWREELFVERLRVQRYGVGGHYGHHFDWMDARMGYARVSSVMAWVDDGEGRLRGGGTEFPLLGRGERGRGDGRWCRFVECEGDGEAVVESEAEAEAEAEAKGDGGRVSREKRQGVVFKPVVGNAVYWENFSSAQRGRVRGYDESWHAGLPVKEGVKVGLNIWSFGRVD